LNLSYKSPARKDKTAWGSEHGRPWGGGGASSSPGIGVVFVYQNEH